MIHEGHRQRLKERFLAGGLEYFQEHEVLELLLTFAIPRKDTNETAHLLLERFGTLHDVLEADPKVLAETPGIGENAACLLALMPPLFALYEKSLTGARITLNNLPALKRYCTALFTGKRNEAFWTLSFDSQLQLLGSDEIAKGTSNQVSVFPRTVLSALLKRNASGAVICHNHPSGIEIPSEEDLELTKKLRHVLEDCGITLHDHILVANGKPLSFLENHWF